MRRLSISTALPCALVYNFLLELDESEAFVLKNGSRQSLHAKATSNNRRATRSEDDTTDASTSVDPEEAMRKAFARLSILTTEEVQLFVDEEDGEQNTSTDDVALVQSFFRKLDSKWEQPLGLDVYCVEKEEEEEEEEKGADEEEDSDEPQLWLPGETAQRQTVSAKQYDATQTYEISQAMKDYEETFSALKREVASDNESSSILNAYVRDDDYTPSKADVDLSRRREKDDVSILIPEPNPQADRDAVSLAGVPYQKVLAGLMSLFPPQDLSLRNAASRKDGYWEYISKGEEPPKQFTYGEFDFYFFGELLDRARYYYTGDEEGSQTSWDGMKFTDIGAGAGRLVFAAAALHPGFKLCRGLEILPSIHQVARGNLEKCRVSKRDSTSFSSSDNDIAEIGTTKLWQIRSYQSKQMPIGLKSFRVHFSVMSKLKIAVTPAMSMRTRTMRTNGLTLTIGHRAMNLLMEIVTMLMETTMMIGRTQMDS